MSYPTTSQGFVFSRLLKSSAAVAFALCGFSAAANELPNGGFENSSTWNVGANHQITTTNPRSGSKSLQITSTGSNHTTFSDKVSANQGDEFVFNSHVRALNLVAEPNGAGDTPIALVRFRDGNGYVKNAHGKRTEGYRWAPYKQNIGTYPYTDDNMQIRFQMTSTGDSFDVGLRSWTHNTSGKTWWDDLSVTKLSFPNRGALVGTYQAEDADSFTKSNIDNFEKDFTGTGYIDVTGNLANITWNNVTGGGVRIISVRYSWEGFVRDIALKVNGTTVETKNAIATGRRGMYATIDFETNLPAGSNTIALEVGKRGGDLARPIIDKFDVYLKAGGGGGPTLPSAPVNVSASDSTLTDKVVVGWDAVTGADTYNVFRDTSTSGAGTLLGSSSTTIFDDTNAVVGITYQYRVQACNSSGCGAFSDWDAGTRGSSGTGGGGLAVVNAASEPDSDISTGAVDFVSLGASEVRMANVAQQIFAVTGVGGTSGNTFTATKYGHSWENGTPAAVGNNVKSGLRVFNNGKGLEFTATAGLSPRTLSIWLTGKGKSGEALSATLSAALSDGSAANVTTNIAMSGTSKIGRLVTLNYSAASEGELITVTLLKTGGNFVSIDAISLSGGSGPVNQPPAIEPVAAQTITEGDPLFIELMATDPEGTMISLTQTNDLPGQALAFQDFGNGLGSIDWSSAVGDAGSYLITVTAEDEDMQSSTIDIEVNVLPVGGATGVLTMTASEVTDRNQTLSGSYIKYAPTNAIAQATNSVGAQPFGPIVPLGGALANRSPAGYIRYSYSGATPADGTRVRGGNRIFDPLPKGVEISIDADASPRSATVYVGVKDVTARLIATLSDGSAAPVILDIDRRNQALRTFALSIDFQAASAGQTVVLQLFVHEETTNSIVGFTQFEAAEQ